MPIEDQINSSPELASNGGHETNYSSMVAASGVDSALFVRENQSKHNKSEL